MRAILMAAAPPGRITDIRLFGMLRRHTNDRLASIPAAPGSHHRCGRVDGISWDAVPVGGPPRAPSSWVWPSSSWSPWPGRCSPAVARETAAEPRGSWGGQRETREKRPIVVLVNDWRGRNPVHNLDAMIHDASCGLARRFGHLPYWRPYPSVQEAEADIGELAFTCDVCLPGQGVHLDRRDRRR